MSRGLDPLIALRHALAPEVVTAIEALIDQRAEEIAERHITARDTTTAKPWLTVAEAAVALGCSEVAVRARHKRGRLQGRHQGSRLYIAHQSIIDLGMSPADTLTATSNQVAPATRERPGARTRRS